MAALDGGLSSCRGADPPGDFSGSRYGASSIRVGARLLGLSDVALGFEWDVADDEITTAQAGFALSQLFAMAGRSEPVSLAERLLTEFGGLDVLLRASPVAVSNAAEDEWSGPFVRSLAVVMRLGLKQRASSARAISSQPALLDYLSFAMGSDAEESLRVLFLDARNRLIRDEVMSRGSIKDVSIYPRTVMRRALDLGAAALILVHNHPSGDVSPSPSDVDVTRKLVTAARLLEIRVHDHIIVSGSQSFSFLDRGLL